MMTVQGATWKDKTGEPDTDVGLWWWYVKKETIFELSLNRPTFTQQKVGGRDGDGEENIADKKKQHM